VAVAEALIRAGANPNAANTFRMTPLSRACTNGSAALVDLLLKAGAAVNFIGDEDSDWPALMYAVDAGDLAVVRLLVAAGADVNLVTRQGDTAWNQASLWGKPEIASFLEQAGAVEAPQARSDLHAAILWNRADYVCALLEQEADSNTRDSDGWTALMASVWWWSNLEIIGLLLEYGAEVNAADKDGQTALLLAARKGASDIVRFLIAKEADVHQADEYAITALMEAASAGEVESVRALLAAGAEAGSPVKFDPLYTLSHGVIAKTAPDMMETASPHAQAGAGHADADVLRGNCNASICR
jgi:ankyrin repeat protein